MIRLALAALLVAATPGSDTDAAAYRARIPVTPGSGSTVQRLEVPAAALAAARTRDLADLRVLDATGRAMPIARVAAAGARPRRDVLPALPILGAAGGLDVKSVSLRLDEQGRARVARLDGTVSGGGSVVLGVLFDARRIAGAARALALDADVPAGQPVTYRAEASRDLSTWRPLGEKVVYRAAGGDADASIPLGDAALHGDYLKVTWSLASRPLSPVVVRRATLLTRPTGPAAGTEIDADALALRDAHAIDFAVPFATPIATVRIVPAGNDLVVPVRILGRDDAEQPWVLLGQGVAGRSAATAIALTGETVRTMRIEADARTPGFTAAPAIRFGFAPAALLFLAVGRAPYTLVAGRDATAAAYLPADSLVTEAGGRPIATAVVAAAPARVALPPVEDARAGRLILWAVLLLATAILAGLAWALWRRNASDDDPTQGNEAAR